jgi:hypothetical protein
MKRDWRKARHARVLDGRGNPTHVRLVVREHGRVAMESRSGANQTVAIIA